jgi:hypothetical protein
LDLGEVEESKPLVSKGLMAGPENKELAQLQKELNDL